MKIEIELYHETNPTAPGWYYKSISLDGNKMELGTIHFPSRTPIRALYNFGGFFKSVVEDHGKRAVEALFDGQNRKTEADKKIPEA